MFLFPRYPKGERYAITEESKDPVWDVVMTGVWGALIPAAHCLVLVLGERKPQIIGQWLSMAGIWGGLVAMGFIRAHTEMMRHKEYAHPFYKRIRFFVYSLCTVTAITTLFSVIGTAPLLYSIYVDGALKKNIVDKEAYQHVVWAALYAGAVFSFFFTLIYSVPFLMRWQMRKAYAILSLVWAGMISGVSVSLYLGTTHPLMFYGGMYGLCVSGGFLKRHRKKGGVLV